MDYLLLDLLILSSEMTTLLATELKALFLLLGVVVHVKFSSKPSVTPKSTEWWCWWLRGHSLLTTQIVTVKGFGWPETIQLRPQPPRAYCVIPGDTGVIPGDTGVKIRNKKRRGWSANCGFQRAIWPGMFGYDQRRWFLVDIRKYIYTICSKIVIWGRGCSHLPEVQSLPVM